MRDNLKALVKLYLVEFFALVAAMLLLDAISNYFSGSLSIDWKDLYQAFIFSFVFTGLIYLFDRNDRKKLGYEVIYDNDNNMIARKSFVSDVTPQELMGRIENDLELKRMNPERNGNGFSLTTKRPKSSVDITTKGVGDQYEYTVTMPAANMVVFSNLLNCGRTLRALKGVM